MSNPFVSNSFFSDPTSTYSELQAKGPFVSQKLPFVGEVLLPTTQAACAQVLKDDATFTVRKADGKVVGLQWWMPKSIKRLTNNMLAMDEPDHSRLRGMVDQAFRRERILALEPRIADLARAQVSTLFAKGEPADLVSLFARQFPLAVICELLGLRDQDRARFTAWAADLGDIRGVLSFLKATRGLDKMTNFLADEIVRIERDGGNGLIADLIVSEHAGQSMTSEELVSMVFLLLVAGHETTTHLISGSVNLLLEDKAALQKMLADENAMSLGVEECLRVATAVLFTKPRFVRRDVVVEGYALKQGQMVMPILGSANHDPKVFDQPARFDINRKPNRHMSFGTGVHFCLGHQLARLELKHALRALFEAFPDLATSEKTPVWRKRFGLRALERLMVHERGN